MNKLKSRVGETLVELLLSMLIISLGMMMLAGAIVTTARLNKQTENLTRAGTVKPRTTSNPLNASFQVDDSTLEDIQLIEQGGVFYYVP